MLGGPAAGQTKVLDGAYAGFQPKPAVEVIMVAMKPLSEKAYLDRALANHKGIAWLDDCRIPTDEPVTVHHAPAGIFASSDQNRGSIKNYRYSHQGHFSANLLVSGDVLGEYSKFSSLPFLIVPKTSKREKNYSIVDCAQGNSHPTVKPLRLMACLIALGSRPGDVVLDPFLGSSTTAIAAKRLGRRFIAIERERKYLAIARARIAAVSQ